MRHNQCLRRGGAPALGHGLPPGPDATLWTLGGTWGSPTATWIGAIPLDYVFWLIRFRLISGTRDWSYYSESGTIITPALTIDLDYHVTADPEFQCQAGGCDVDGNELTIFGPWQTLRSS